MSFFSRQASLSFPTYMLPSLPFRRKPSSESATSSTSSGSDRSRDHAGHLDDNHLPLHAAPREILPGTTSCIRCRRCAAELCLTNQVVSRGFTGRFGRAYLVAPLDHGDITSQSAMTSAALANTAALKPEPRNLVTGAHVVSNVECTSCGTDLGWKYVNAEEESQRYKIGKYILETARVTTTTRWETSKGLADGGIVGGKTLDCLMTPAIIDGEEIEFDSQDEDECEDLFMGQWTPELALKRRKAKAFMGMV